MGDKPIVRGLHELLGCFAAGHSGDAPEVRSFKLGLSNLAGVLCLKKGIDPTIRSRITKASIRNSM